MTDKINFKERILDAISLYHEEGNIVKAMNLTRLWIAWEQAIFREQIYQLKKQSGITLHDIYGH
jgi:meiotically up-regulated gene 157 (Mug157) protein